MILCVDVDNVLNNLQESVVNLFNERHGTSYVLDDFYDYNIENVLPVKEAVMMKDMYGESDIYDHVRPIDGAQDALKKLINEGHQVYLVTDAIPKNYNEKIEWIHHFFSFIDDAHIVAMKHKHLFKCDIMIEDNLRNLISGMHYERICMNYPWNQSTKDWLYDIFRVNNWDDIIDTIHKLTKNEME